MRAWLFILLIAAGGWDLAQAGGDLAQAGGDLAPQIDPCGNACGTGEGCCGWTCKPLNTVTDCGMCGNACPAANGTNDITCVDPAAKRCGMTCRGENYDVNNNMSDGCERLHPTSNHDLDSAIDLGTTDCYGSIGAITKSLFSDSRGHAPSVLNFKGAVGSAPDTFKTLNTGGVACYRTYDVSFSTAGGGNTVCYTCTILVDNKPVNHVIVNGHGSASMSGGPPAYDNNSTIQFKVEKTCSLPVQEAITYSIRHKFGPM